MGATARMSTRGWPTLRTSEVRGSTGRHAFAKTRFDGHEPRTSTLNHLAFEIPFERYEAERRRLEDLGLKPRPTVFETMSARALFFQDPERAKLTSQKYLELYGR